MIRKDKDNHDDPIVGELFLVNRSMSNAEIWYKDIWKDLGFGEDDFGSSMGRPITPDEIAVVIHKLKTLCPKSNDKSQAELVDFFLGYQGQGRKVAFLAH